MADHLIWVTEIALSALAGLVWLIRLEGKVKHAEDKADLAQKDVDDLRVRHENLDSKIVTELSEVKQSLARIEGFLKAKSYEP